MARPMMAAMPHRYAPLSAMNTRFAVEMPVETPDGAGGQERSYLAFGALWGQLKLVSGEERWRADRAEQALRWRIETRWRTGIEAGMRLKAGARVFDILSAADPDGTRRRLLIEAEEVTR